MAGMDENSALAASLGEFTVDTIGRESLDGLHVLLDTRAGEAWMIVVLRDNSDAEQRRAIEKLFEVEDVFADEVSLSFVFATEIPDEVRALTSSKAVFSYA